MNTISATVLNKGLAALSLLLLGGTSLADQPNHGQQDATATLKRVQQTLASAQSLTADFTASSEYPTFYRDSLEKGTVTLAKPNKVAVRLDRFRKFDAESGWQSTGNRWTSISDGASWKNLTQHADSAQHRTRNAPASPEKLLENIEPLREFFAQNSLPLREPRHAGKQIWEGQNYEVIEGKSGTDGTIQIFVGTDGLIHRFLSQTTIGGKSVRREVTLRNFRLNSPVKPQTFALAIPSEAQAVVQESAIDTLKVGDDAPDFVVQDATGKSVRLSDFKGQVVVLKFFATWCGSCRQSLPHTQEVVTQFAKQKVTALAVDIWDSPKALQKWQKREGAKYPALRFAVDPAPQGTDIASQLYGVRFTPTVFVITPKGKIGAVIAGYNGPSPVLETALRAALQE